MKTAGFQRISLKNPDPSLVREDTSAKSIAFFARVRPIWIDKVFYEELKEVSTIRGNRNVRLCLHSTPEDQQHDMVILNRKGTLYPPHRHPGKTATYHVMEGRLAMFSFDTSGDPVEAGVLGAGELYRFDQAHFHMVMTLDDFTIFHETTIGPFLGDSDFIFPAWGPRAGDNAAMRQFSDRCVALLGSYA